MTPNEYQRAALRTDGDWDFYAKAHVRLNSGDPDMMMLLHAAVGIASEAGELQDALKKHIYYGREVTRQITRLAALSGYADVPEEGIAELSRALASSAESVEHCEEIISTYLRVHRWMPTPSDIYAIAEQTKGEQPVPESSRRCKGCGGTGFARVWVLKTYNRHPNGEIKAAEESRISEEVYKQLRGKVDGTSQLVGEAVCACQCEYGQRLLAARLAREAEDESKRKGRAA